MFDSWDDFLSQTPVSQEVTVKVSGGQKVTVRLETAADLTLFCLKAFLVRLRRGWGDPGIEEDSAGRTALLACLINTKILFIYFFESTFFHFYLSFNRYVS